MRLSLGNTCFLFCFERSSHQSWSVPLRVSLDGWTISDFTFCLQILESLKQLSLNVLLKERTWLYYSLGFTIMHFTEFNLVLAVESID